MTHKWLTKRPLATLAYQWLTVGRQKRTARTSAKNSLKIGHLRRLKPVSRMFGFDRGQPIDRYYIEKFLARYHGDIQRHVMEIGDASYTHKFGGDRITKSDVLHIKVDNPAATIVGDLTQADHIPSNTFDCIILTQTLQFIYDVQAALQTIESILRPGGIVLATFSGISQIAADMWGKYQSWAFTSLSAQRLFEEVFPAANVQIEAFGNVLTAVAFLQGLAAEELNRQELDHRDENFEVIITVRAKKFEKSS